MNGLHERGRRLVDLVYDNNWFKVELKRLVEHESCLRHGAFGSVDEQQYAVCEFEHAFDLSAEVAVSRGVDDIYLDVLVMYAHIFRENGYSAFAFEVVAVEKAVSHLLIVPEKLGLSDNFVYECGFAMVDVSNYGYVPDFTHLSPFLIISNSKPII